MALKNAVSHRLEREDSAQRRDEVLGGGREGVHHLLRILALLEDLRIEIFKGCCRVEATAVDEVLIVTEVTLLLCLVEGFLVRRRRA